MQRLRNHFLFWISYILFKTYLNIADNTELDWNRYVSIFSVQLIFLVVKVPLVYTCFYSIDSYLSGKWKQWQVLSTLLLLLMSASVAMSILNHLVVLPYLQVTTTTSIFAFGSLLYHSFTLSFVTGLAVAIRLMRRQSQARVREIELQKEKTETELKYLKGQINPHFLFNTLNNIYSLARKGSDQTSDAILKLSKLMRFMLYESANATILLSDELKLIRDYIELEKLRYSERLTVNFTDSIDNPYQQIAPLILIHFVENAFKHGASESRFESTISIEIKLNDGILKAHIANSKGSDTQNENENHIGMKNIKRQLELVYPQHTLSIFNSPTEFVVDLTLSLNR